MPLIVDIPFDIDTAAHSMLMGISSECGYFDQAHMNRDFRAFARITPGEWLGHRGDETKDHHLALR